MRRRSSRSALPTIVRRRAYYYATVHDSYFGAFPFDALAPKLDACNTRRRGMAARQHG